MKALFMQAGSLWYGDNTGAVKICDSALVPVRTSHGFQRNLICTPSGRLYVVVKITPPLSVPGVLLYYSDNQGDSWTGPLRADTSGGNPKTTVDMCIDSSERVHITWSGWYPGGVLGYYLVRYRRWNGSAWASADDACVNIGVTNWRATSQAIACNGSDQVMIVFKAVYANFYETLIVPPTFIFIGAVYPELNLQALGDDFHLFRFSGLGPLIHHQRVAGVWSQVSNNVSEGNLQGAGMWTAMTLNNKIHLAYAMTRFAHLEYIRYRTFDGATWSTPETAVPGKWDNARVSIGYRRDLPIRTVYMSYWTGGLGGVGDIKIVQRDPDVPGWSDTFTLTGVDAEPAGVGIGEEAIVAGFPQVIVVH